MPPRSPLSPRPYAHLCPGALHVQILSPGCEGRGEQPSRGVESGAGAAALAPRDWRLPARLDLGCLIPFRRGEGQQRRGDMTD